MNSSVFQYKNKLIRKRTLISYAYTLTSEVLLKVLKNFALKYCHYVLKYSI